jgi:hypothetical protein
MRQADRKSKFEQIGRDRDGLGPSLGAVHGVRKMGDQVDVAHHKRRTRQISTCISIYKIIDWDLCERRSRL